WSFSYLLFYIWTKGLLCLACLSHVQCSTERTHANTHTRAHTHAHTHTNKHTHTHTATHTPTNTHHTHNTTPIQVLSSVTPKLTKLELNILTRRDRLRLFDYMII